jgi:hypothetical protein
MARTPDLALKRNLLDQVVAYLAAHGLGESVRLLKDRNATLAGKRLFRNPYKHRSFSLLWAFRQFHRAESYS